MPTRRCNSRFGTSSLRLALRKSTRGAGRRRTKPSSRSIEPLLELRRDAPNEDRIEEAALIQRHRGRVVAGRDRALELRRIAPETVLCELDLVVATRDDRVVAD